MRSLAGSFLVARRILRESSFRQTVILLMQHGEEGAFGLVINRPAIVEQLPFPVYAGGPCESEGLLLLHCHPEWSNLNSKPGAEVAPGIFLGDATCLQHVYDPAPGQILRFRLFKGYAGWAAGQLEGEIASGAWSIVSATAEIMFDIPPDEVWDRLIPPHIPEPSIN